MGCMSDLRLAFFGDIVGSPGRRAVAHAVARLKVERAVGLFIANAENSRNGSGLSQDNYRELLRSGLHAMTLGDHCFKDRQIIPVLEHPDEPIARPANLAEAAPGKGFTLIRPSIASCPPIAIVTVLGRIFMPIPTDNPFIAVDREIANIASLAPDALVIVEIHGETTSEKQAMAYYALKRHSTGPGPRIIAVLGSHTHVQTSDARIIDHRLAALTDLGMCGPHRSVIGRDVQATLNAMVHQNPSPLDVASDDNRACGAIITIDVEGRRASEIEAMVIRVPE